MGSVLRVSRQRPPGERGIGAGESLGVGDVKLVDTLRGAVRR